LGGGHTAGFPKRIRAIDGGGGRRIGAPEEQFPLLPDSPDIYPVWESLVIQYRVAGKPAHDARLVAAMLVHGLTTILTTILTFDRTGFSRFAGIEVLHPGDAAS
jgi:predicted nucleic acid-binding protein